ncbi:MAG: hypothetical protein WBD20_23295 [Pirellulaceae bacterium]
MSSRLQPIDIPDSIKQIDLGQTCERLIDTANDRIESFMLSDQKVIPNFVTCDFHLLAQALRWIDENHLCAGNRFMEWGSGFGVGVLLAALNGKESVGIEIEQVLCDEASRLSDAVDVRADFYCGSFVPHDVPGLLELSAEVKNVDTHEDDMYEYIGLEIEDFDLVFAFPWPGENGFFEAVFEACAADGALLLTYRGREGMHLLRKG